MNLIKFLPLLIFLFLISCSNNSAPDFNLKSTDEKVVRLSDYEGKIVILDFWATWCPPCRAGIPDFVKLKNEYGDKGVEVIGISLDQDRGKVVPFMKNYKINYPVVYGDMKVTEDYGGVKSIPTTFVIDANGNIVNQFVGLQDISVFKNSIEKLLGQVENKSKEVSDEMRMHSEEYLSGLKALLTEKMQSGGPSEAINICSQQAEKLASDYGQKNMLEIKRVSFKYRNENDKPDVYESDILNEFQKLKDKGQLSPQTEHFETLEYDGARYVRYMKPIIVAPVCLSCHGQEADISPEVLKLLKEKYPNDLATGYKTGELRGAVSIMKVL